MYQREPLVLPCFLCHEEKPTEARPCLVWKFAAYYSPELELGITRSKQSRTDQSTKPLAELVTLLKLPWAEALRHVTAIADESLRDAQAWSDRIDAEAAAVRSENAAFLSELAIAANERRWHVSDWVEALLPCPHRVTDFGPAWLIVDGHDVVLTPVGLWTVNPPEPKDHYRVDACPKCCLEENHRGACCTPDQLP